MRKWMPRWCGGRRGGEGRGGGMRYGGKGWWGGEGSRGPHSYLLFPFLSLASVFAMPGGQAFRVTNHLLL